MRLHPPDPGSGYAGYLVLLRAVALLYAGPVSYTHLVYIEAFGKKLVIHTDNRLSGRKEDTVSGYTLAGMLALLEGGPFVQCHKSYIVNRDYIDRIDKAGRKIYLKGFTEVVPVGNKYQAGMWGEA